MTATDTAVFFVLGSKSFCCTAAIHSARLCGSFGMEKRRDGPGLILHQHDECSCRAVATEKKLVRPKYEECEKKNDGKSCEARQAVRSTALLQLGAWGGGGGGLGELLKISHFPITKLTGFD